MSIRKIAKLAGVSTTTVSRVINNYDYVSDDLRQKVLSVMKEINYVPNRNAINLSNGQSQVIGVVVPYVRNSGYDQLIEGVLEEATKCQKKVMLLPTYFNKNLEKTYYRLLQDKTLDGIIVTSKTHDDSFILELSQFGDVVVTEKTTLEMIPAVYPDRLTIYHDVFSYLLSQFAYKCKIYVAVFRDEAQSLTTRAKRSVFSHYFPQANLEETFISNIFNFDDGYRLGKKLFQSKEQPIIIYCTGDNITSGILKAAKENKFVFRKDFYLISEENEFLSDVLAIDSIDFNLKQVGIEAVDHLLAHQTGHKKISGQFIQKTESIASI